MPEFHYPNAAHSLRDLVITIDACGDKVAPRGQMTKELRHVTIVIDDPNSCTMTGVNRKGYNPRLAALEALSLISGWSYPALYAKVAPGTTKFQDGGTFHGAYGPRLRIQIPKIIDVLKHDGDSRQAIATIWDPMYDGHNDTRDTPCTVYLSFMIRDGYLIMHTHMRSNDVWWGWCYDVTQFCVLQMHVAAALGLGVGEYVHYSDSFHMYEKDFDDAMQVTYPDGPNPDVYPLITDWRQSAWENQKRLARDLLDGNPSVLPQTTPESGRYPWLVEQAWRIHNQ